MSKISSGKAIFTFLSLGSLALMLENAFGIDALTGPNIALTALILSLIFMLHTAKDRAVRDAVGEIDRLDVVKDKTVVIRVESFE